MLPPLKFSITKEHNFLIYSLSSQILEYRNPQNSTINLKNKTKQKHPQWLKTESI